MTDTTPLPDKIGKYKINKCLGRGGMGEVFLAYDEDIERKVAIKTVLKDIAQEGSGEAKNLLTRFKNEVKVAARCEHPNLVRILDFNYDGDAPFIVMEFVKGISLKTLLQNQRLTLTQVNKIFWQLLSGLTAVHRAGIIHRDLKPANLLITEKLDVKITDFGVSLDSSKLIENKSNTITRTVVGSYRYMPIEQHTGEAIDTRADLYSATMVLLDMILGAKYTSKISTFCLSELSEIYVSFRLTPNHLVLECFRQIFKEGLSLKPEKRPKNIDEYLKIYRSSISSLNQELSTMKSGGHAAPNPQADTSKADVDKDKVVREELFLLDVINTLQPIIGPIAETLVESVYANNHNFMELVMKVSEEIPDTSERTEFIKVMERKLNTRDDNMIGKILKDRNGDTMLTTKLGDKSNTMTRSRVSGTGTGAGNNRFSLSIDQRKQVIELYATYIGPFAEFVLDEKFALAKDRRSFLSQLADEIPSSEKDDFITKCNRLLMMQ